MRWIELLPHDDRRLGEVIALEQLESQVLAQFDLFGGFHLLGQQFLAERPELRDQRLQLPAFHAQDVDLDDVGQFEQRPVGFVDPDEVVDGQREALVAQLSAAVDHFRRGNDGFQDFQNDNFRRQCLDQIVEQEFLIDVDMAAVGTQRLVGAEFGEGIDDDRGGGLRGIGDLGAVGGEDGTFAKKQFVRQQLLFASENRLAAKEYLRIQVFGHVGSDAFARESMAGNCIGVCMATVIGA